MITKFCPLFIKSGLFCLILAVLPFYGCKKDGENIKNHLPKADFEVDPGRGDVNTVFNFDASSVTDVEDPTSALEIRWDWNRDKIFDTEFSTNKTASHQYSQVGIYRPLVEVRDSKGMTDTLKQLIVVVSDLSNRPPEIPLYITPPEWQDWMDVSVIFKWTCTDPDGDPLTYDIWIGRSRTSLELRQSGITDFNLVDNVPQFETTVSGFSYDTDYYWQIGARDVAGNYTVGLISKFSTRPVGNK
ncbi:MAG: PKD domain-containing protein [Bacteroidales bacterium]|jgi:PKD repeat protein|nr:PKD domain-containing protein [Bacteroidales bacterium]